ncbi:MAG: DUF748 domain-containing protein [Thermodesulfobacteriota bacterium]
MGRRMKILLALLILAIAAGLAILAAVRFLPETDLVRDQIRNGLEKLSGQNVSVGSVKVSLSVSNLLELSLAGLSVTSQDGKPLLSADAIQFSPSLGGLLDRRISVKSVNVHRLHASIRRQDDGTIQDLVRATEPQVRPPAGEPDREEAVPRPTPPASTASPVPEPPHEKPQKVAWSVEAIRLTDARLDWLDRQIVPGQEVAVSLKQVNGTLIRKGQTESFAADFTGKLAGDDPEAGTVSVSGTITFTPNFSGLANAAVTLAAKSVNLKIFRHYIPPSARAGEHFQSAAGTADLAWQAGQPTKVMVNAQLHSASERSVVNLHGTIVTNEGFSTITQIDGTVETDSLPLRFLRAYLPSQVPLNPDTGTLKARIAGRWAEDEAWSVTGDIGIEDAGLAGKLGKIVSKARVWLKGSVNPHELTLENLEIADSAKLASISGGVTSPFSSARRLELKGEVIVRQPWLGALGVSVPSELVVGGTVPVRFVAQGRPDDLWIDLTGDLTGAGIKWTPYLEKPRGKPGTVSVRGRAHFNGESALESIVQRATLSLGMSEATVKLREEGPQLSGCALQFDGKIAFEKRGTDLTDATLAIRRGAGARTLLLAKANIKDLGSDAFAIHGTATATLDKTTLALAGLERDAGIRTAGSALLQARFKGTKGGVDWSFEMPLNHMDVTVPDIVRKSPGVDGALKASGKWTPSEVLLSYGQLTLPGVLVTAQGIVRDKDGQMKDVLVSTKNTRVEHLARFVLPLQNRGLTGEADISVRLKQSDRGIATQTSIRPISIDFVPKGSPVAVRSIRGLVESDGKSLDIKELTGRLSGHVQGPITVAGALHNIGSVRALQGDLSANMGRGKINAGTIRNLLSQANALLGTVLDPARGGAPDNPLDFDSASGKFSFASGVATTDDLKLKGPGLGLAAIGSYDLTSAVFDALVGVRTSTAVPAALGKIPAVRKLVKEHEGLLKALGVDRELKRLGLDGSTPESQESTSAAGKTPITVIVKVKGPARDITVVPVLEASLKKDTATRLKDLLN